MIESTTIKLHQCALGRCSNSGCSWCVIEKSEFAKSLSWNVVFEVSDLTLDHLGALESARVKHIHAVTLITFSDDRLISLNTNFLNSVKHNT